MMMDQLFRQPQPMYSQDRNRGKFTLEKIQYWLLMELHSLGMSGGEGRGGQQRRRNGGRRRMRNGNGGGGCRYEDGNNENNQMDSEEWLYHSKFCHYYYYYLLFFQHKVFSNQIKKSIFVFFSDQTIFQKY